MDIEVDKTPDPGQRSRLKRITDFISQSVEIGQKEVERSHELEKSGFMSFNALHLACAESGKADVFLTTDDRLLRLAKRHTKDLRIKVESPLEWIKENLE